jgi:phospholipid/cholesterol/gamma-HCH transport system substrate-binding protein
MITKGGNRDILTGAVVVIVGALLLALSYSTGGRAHSRSEGYTLTARFHRADGISVGSQVRLSGMTIGRVVDQALDDQFRAVLTLQVPANIALTEDTAAVIYTDGLLGAKFVELKPGADDQVLKPGEEIRYTQDAVVVEDLLAMIIQQARAKRGYLNKPLPSASN